jgi:hypothetical protein
MSNHDGVISNRYSLIGRPSLIDLSLKATALALLFRFEPIALAGQFTFVAR